ncbi:MAG TPA: pitrilysin family protein [Syntrophales bacterium]|nr:pitrilysin family protein [Syntrophales bacterium]
MSTHNKTVLPNGIRIVSEEIKHVRSISIGVWVQSGSRYEDRTINGTAHFIEHMLFKGTKNRSSFDIASAIDSVGGIINAFTGKELTSFYIKIPDYHLAMAVDLLADIFINSRFDEEEIIKEQSVILQEIKMVEDSPDDYIHDFFESVFWNGHPLGLSVLGTRDLISTLNRETLVAFFNDRYKGDNLVLAAAGNLKHDEFVDLVNRTFGSMSGKSLKSQTNEPVISSKTAVVKKDLEQVHVIIGTVAPSAINPKRYSSFILNAILGGSMSSRLFQEIREKRGLAYAIHSYLNPYSDAGFLGIYAGTGKDRLQIVISLILEELKRLRDYQLTEKEMTQAKELIKGNFLLSMESTDNRMIKLAKNEIFFGRFIPAEDITAFVDAVSAEDVRNMAVEIFNPGNISLVAMGMISEKDVSLNCYKG